MRRLCPLLVLLALTAGCGEDGGPVEREGVVGAPPGRTEGLSGLTSLTELEGLLQRRADLDLVRTGGRELGPQAGVPVLAHTRYEESQAGLEFDVWIAGDERAARAAVENLAGSEAVEEGGRLARGGNVVVLFPDATVDTDLSRRVRGVLATLRAR